MDRLLRMYSQLTSLLDRDRAEKENESESSFQVVSVPLEYSRGASRRRSPLPLFASHARCSQSVGQVAQSAKDWRRRQRIGWYLPCRSPCRVATHTSFFFFFFFLL